MGLVLHRGWYYDWYYAAAGTNTGTNSLACVRLGAGTSRTRRGYPKLLIYGGAGREKAARIPYPSSRTMK